MNLQELLHDVVMQERDNPSVEGGKQYRAIYYKDQTNPVVLSGWFHSADLALAQAKDHLLGGILDGKSFDLVSEDGKIEIVEDVKDLIASLVGKITGLGQFGLDSLGALGAGVAGGLGKLFSFNNGKVNLSGSETEVFDGLLNLFGNFKDAGSDVKAAANKLLLGNAVKAVTRGNGTGSFDLDDLFTLLTNPKDAGINFLKKFLTNSKPEQKEENKSIFDWFNNDYYSGLRGDKNATSTYADTSFLRDKVAGLLDEGKKGILPSLGLGALGAGVAGGLGKLFSFKNGTVNLSGSETEVFDGLLNLFGDFKDSGSDVKAAANKLLLGNAVKAVTRGNGTGSFDLDDLFTLLTNPKDAGINFLKKFLTNSKPEQKEENKSIFDWFNNDYYSGLRGDKNATSTYADTSFLRDKVAGLLDDGKKGILPSLGLGALGAGALAGAGNVLGNVADSAGNLVDSGAGALNSLKDKLAGLFSFKDGKLNMSGNEEEVSLGLLSAFDGFKDLPEPTAVLNKLALDNAAKVVTRSHKSGSFDLDDLNTVLTNPEGKGESFLKKFLNLSTPEQTKENKSLFDWFNNDYYSGLRGDKNATPTYKETAPLRSKLADLLDNGKKGILPTLGLAGLAGSALAGAGNVLGSVADGASKVAQGASNLVDSGVSKVSEGVSGLKDAVTAPFGSSTKEEPKKKKRRIWPWIATAAGLGAASLPFWAVPYKISYRLPETAVIENAPTSYRFYENVELPTASEEGKTFEGWYSDEALTNPVRSIKYSLGGKTLYPKFTEEEAKTDTTAAQPTPEPTPEVASEQEVSALKTSFDGLKGLFDDWGKKLDSASEDAKKEYESLTKELDDLQSKINSGSLTPEELKEAQSKLDDLTKRFNTLSSGEGETATGDSSTTSGTGTSTTGTGTGTNTGTTSGSGTTGTGTTEKDPVVNTSTK